MSRSTHPRSCATSTAKVCRSVATGRTGPASSPAAGPTGGAGGQAAAASAPRARPARARATAPPTPPRRARRRGARSARDSAGGDVGDGVLEQAVGGLRRPVGVEDAALPADEVRVVAELEVEERAHGGLAVGEPDGCLELPALKARIEELRDGLLAVVRAAAGAPPALGCRLPGPERPPRAPPA